MGEWSGQQLRLNSKKQEANTYLTYFLKKYKSLGDGSGLDPLSCLATTHRCYHAAQAYTAKPVALYVRPEMVVKAERRGKSSDSSKSKQLPHVPHLSLFHPVDDVTTCINRNKIRKLMELSVK